MLKKFFCILCLIGFSFASSIASDPLEEFKKVLTGQTQQEAETRLKELCKDLAPMMNSNISHEGETLKLLGFDVGLKVTAKPVSDKNVIVSGITQYLPIGSLQLEVGLPAKLNLLGRYGAYEKFSLWGAGIKYNLFKSAIPGLPDISLLGFASQLTHTDYCSTTSGSANLALSLDLPVVKPFVGVGYDFIEIKVNEDVTRELSLEQLKATSDGFRLEGGVNFSFTPFTYLYIGAGFANETLLYNLSVGVKFGGI
ncbi:MAG: hypothetical protein QME68_03605 [Elusimicrobiota bacterium]|nr:hypothetical protein [Elusimicrobiota bacterium]